MYGSSVTRREILDGKVAVPKPARSLLENLPGTRLTAEIARPPLKTSFATALELHQAPEVRIICCERLGGETSNEHFKRTTVTTLNPAQLDQLSINTLRFLSVDAVQKANSGHPGLPLGAAPMAYVLWTRFLRHNPVNPQWSNRDRFVLSAGHGSALLYSLLHVTGYDLPLDQIKQFRQWGSITPGHPERGLTPGVETTTGPLGQGFGNGVGMAISEAHLAARYNRPGFRDRRSFHLRVGQRRRPDGGRVFRSGLARRAVGTRQADLPFRQQPCDALRRYEHHL